MLLPITWRKRPYYADAGAAERTRIILRTCYKWNKKTQKQNDWLTSIILKVVGFKHYRYPQQDVDVFRRYLFLIVRGSDTKTSPPAAEASIISSSRSFSKWFLLSTIMEKMMPLLTGIMSWNCIGESNFRRILQQSSDIRWFCSLKTNRSFLICDNLFWWGESYLW